MPLITRDDAPKKVESGGVPGVLSTPSPQEWLGVSYREPSSDRMLCDPPELSPEDHLERIEADAYRIECAQLRAHHELENLQAQIAVDRAVDLRNLESIIHKAIQAGVGHEEIFDLPSPLVEEALNDLNTNLKNIGDPA